MDDHQASCVEPSAVCTSALSLPKPTSVPSLIACSKTFWVAVRPLSMSAHLARGMIQLETYVYRRGFSFTSCAGTPVDARSSVATVQAVAATPKWSLVILVSPDVPRSTLCCSRCAAKYTLIELAARARVIDAVGIQASQVDAR